MGKGRNNPLISIISMGTISSAIFLCVFLTILMTALVFAVEAIPFDSLKSQAYAWLLGTPQANVYNEYEGYGDGSGSSDGGGDGESEDGFYAGEDGVRHSGIQTAGVLAYDGYEGPTSFYCGNLFVQQDYLPDDPRYYSRISDCYGTERYDTNTGERLHDHTGIDFGVNQGTPVRSAMGGKVVFAGVLPGWGYTILIENQGVQQLYGHATSLILDGAVVEPDDIVGEIIEAGDVIMTIGGNNGDDRDGSSTGAHLHFEIRICKQDPDTEVVICHYKDPQTVIFPGQVEVCNWYENVNNPERNAQCIGW